MSAAATTRAASAQQNHVLGHHLGRVNLLAVLIFIAARMQPAFHVNLLALGQGLRQVLRAPQDHVGPVGVFLPFAGLLVLPAAGSGHAELRYRRLRRRVGGLRVAAQMANKNHFIYATACHDCLSVPYARTAISSAAIAARAAAPKAAAALGGLSTTTSLALAAAILAASSSYMLPVPRPVTKPLTVLAPMVMAEVG